MDDDRAWAAPESGTGVPVARPARSWAAAAAAPAFAGDVPPPPLPLRPSTVADLLDGSFAAIRSSPRKVVTITAAFVVPVQLLLAFAARNISGAGLADVFSTDRSFSSTDPSGEPDTGVLVLGYGSVFVLSFVLMFVTAALAGVVAAWYSGHDMTVGAALRGAVRRSPALVAAWVLVHLLEIVALVPCGFTVLFLMPMFWVTAPAIVLERLGPVAAMRRSWRLVRRRYWPTMLIVLLTLFVAMVLQWALPVLPSVLAGLLPSSISWIASGLASSASALITMTVVAVCSILVYLDLRIRTEGLDLELDAARLLDRVA